MPTTESKAKMKEGFGKIGKALLGVGLPVLGTAIGGPMGGVLATSVATALGLSADASASEVSLKLAEADPAALVKLKELEVQVELARIASEVSAGQDITARHAADMASDNTLSKYVRPCGLIFVLVTYVLYVYLITFSDKDTDSMQAALEAGKQLLSLAEGFVYFYVGSRGVEKAMSIYTKLK
jgi:hypothetical protein